MRRLPPTLLSLVLAGALGISSCGSDEKQATETTAGSEGSAVDPEDVIVDDAVVTRGLTELPATIASAIGAIGTPDAKAKLDAIEAEWFSFEGTVRSNDPDLYLAIEDQLSPLQAQIADGDTATATATATTLSGLFAQYLAKFP